MRAASCASPWPMPPAPSSAIRILSLAIAIVVPLYIDHTHRHWVPVLDAALVVTQVRQQCRPGGTQPEGGVLDHWPARAHRVEEIGMVLEIVRVAGRGKIMLLVRFGHGGRCNQTLGVTLAVGRHDL